MQKLQADVDMTCRRIGLAVSPVRSTAFEILTQLMLSSEADKPLENPDALAPLLKVFADCEEMLTNGISAEFREIDAEPPAELETARVAALEAVSALQKTQKAIASGRTLPRHSVFRELAERVETDLRPKIGAFLGALNDFSRQESLHRQHNTQSLVAKTIEEIEKISLAIKIISLNASVEAAHAGDAGKGFAVIATEIRALSTKSKDALDAIKVELL